MLISDDLPHLLTVKEYDLHFNQTIHKYYWDSSKGEVVRRSQDLSDRYGLKWSSRLTGKQAEEFFEKQNVGPAFDQARREFRLRSLG